LAPSLTFVLLVGASACGQAELQPELVPGTERIDPGDRPWFTISPTERYVAFMEADSGSGDAATGFHLVTMDMSSSAKTHHQLQDLPPKVLGTRLRPWNYVGIGFTIAGWENDKLLVHIQWNPPLTYWLAFTPGQEQAQVVPAPVRPSCSDCPPPAEWLDVITSRNLPTGDWPLHVPYREGRFSAFVYRTPVGSDFRGAVIEKVRSDGTTEVLVEHERALKKLNVGSLRVSPDEEYVAYELVSQLRSPVPLPTMRHELFVRHIPTGTGQRVMATYRLMGNLMWSADSKRLYYAVVDGPVADGVTDGVYCIDLSGND
jgi:hypothetical protein